MPLYRASLQTLGATVLLALALACHGSSKSTPAVPSQTVTIAGTVTYDRVPLAFDANGVPTGLKDASVAANLVNLPARGATIRVYQQLEQTQPDGTKSLVWTIYATTVTDSTGKYTIQAHQDRPTMVELLSTFDAGTIGSVPKFIHVVAEPQGINSPTTALNRLQYCMRKAADGSAPASTNVPNSISSSASVVNFSVGLNDAWWVSNPSFNLITHEAPAITQAVLETDLPGRTTGAGSGSRILGIGDTIATFKALYGIAVPGETLDLHYWPGRSEPRGSYVEYNPYLYPQAFDPSISNYRFFASLRADSTNDDAWDEGVILPLLARNVLYTGNRGRTFSVTLNPLFPTGTALGDLSPDAARIEGLAEAMAANILKSPYLADTQNVGLAAPVIDIRDYSMLTPSQLTPYAAPGLRAYSWEIILKANSLPSPGVAADWATINPLAAARFFLAPSFTNEDTSVTPRDKEPLNIYSQIKRLSEVKSIAEPVDLAAVFTDPVLTALGAPFGIIWPRPATGPYALFVANWGTDPSAPFPAVALSMSKAVQVDMPYSISSGVVGYQLAYPNQSQGEVFYAGFSLTADKRCVLSATVSPALGPGAQVAVDLPRMQRTFVFSGSGGSTEAIVIPMNGTSPLYHPLRVWLQSPSAVQPDVTVTLSLLPAP